MASLLHSAARSLCAHGGLASPAEANGRIRMAGVPVLTAGATLVISCTAPGGEACRTALLIQGATRVFSGGLPLALQTSQAVCEQSGQTLFFPIEPRRASAV